MSKAEFHPFHVGNLSQMCGRDGILHGKVTGIIVSTPGFWPIHVPAPRDLCQTRQRQVPRVVCSSSGDRNTARGARDMDICIAGGPSFIMAVWGRMSEERKNTRPDGIRSRSRWPDARGQTTGTRKVMFFRRPRGPKDAQDHGGSCIEACAAARRVFRFIFVARKVGRPIQTDTARCHLLSAFVSRRSCRLHLLRPPSARKTKSATRRS